MRKRIVTVSQHGRRIERGAPHPDRTKDPLVQRHVVGYAEVVRATAVRHAECVAAGADEQVVVEELFAVPSRRNDIDQRRDHGFGGPGGAVKVGLDVQPGDSRAIAERVADGQPAGEVRVADGELGQQVDQAGLPGEASIIDQ